MKRIIFAIIILWSNVASADEQHLTLTQAKEIALKNHPQIRSSEFMEKAAGENVDIVRSNYLPQITGDATKVFAGNNTRIAATDGNLNNPIVINRASGGVAVSQLITDFGKTSDLIASSRLKLNAQKQRSQLTREIVLLDVTTAYYNVLKSQSILKVAEDTLKSRKLLLEQINLLHDAKMKSDLDFSIAKQTVDDANLLLLKARNALEDSEATLSEALGYSEHHHITLANDAKVTPPPSHIEPIIADAMEHNPELATLKAEKDAAKKLADAANKANYPKIEALGYAGGTPISDSSQPIRSNYAAAGVTITIPFYTGGRLSAQENEASFKAQAAEQDLEIKNNKLLRDLRVAFDNVQTAYKNIEVTKQFLKNSSDAFRLTQERYNIGKSSIVDLSQAQLVKTQAQISNNDATYEYLIQLAILQYQVGGDL